MAQQFTPWQKMKASEDQVRKIDDYWIYVKRCNERFPQVDENTIIARADICQPFLTYYNNGKENVCCKTPYDYNFGYCEGYDQSRHRCDRKHPYYYMHIDLEEEYPCRSVPILTSTHHGHRPPIDPMPPIPRKREIEKFFRSHGTSYCINANGYETVTLNPTWAFRWNQGFGYTYSPPKGY